MCENATQPQTVILPKSHVMQNNPSNPTHLNYEKEYIKFFFEENYEKLQKIKASKKSINFQKISNDDFLEKIKAKKPLDINQILIPNEWLPLPSVDCVKYIFKKYRVENENDRNIKKILSIYLRKIDEDNNSPTNHYTPTQIDNHNNDWGWFVDCGDEDWCLENNSRQSS
jgi:hypothetical protein